MTILRVLNIQKDMLREEDHDGWRVAQRIWLAAGRPTERRKLIDTIENALNECRAEGVYYPKILLKRKKELERHAFSPGQSSAQGKPQAPPVKQDVKCQECQDRGYIPIGSGLTATLCKCQVPHAQPDPPQTQA